MKSLQEPILIPPKTTDDVHVISADLIQKTGLFVLVWQYLLWAYQKRSFIKVITVTDLKRSIIQTKLAYLWWLLDPFFNFVCYLFLVMVLARGRNMQVPYALYIMTAILPWHFTMKSITASTTLWNKHKSLIAQIRLPYINLLISSLLYELAIFTTSQIIVIGACFYYGYYPTIYWLFLPLVVLMQAFFSFACMLLNSLIGFTFYDYHKILPFFLRIWFFVSPAIWSIEMLPARYQKIFYYNPMTFIFESYRNILLYNKGLNLGHLELFFLFTVLLSITGLVLFIRKEPYINRYI